MDHDWKRLKAEVPNLRKAPSEYVTERVRFTTQPTEETETPSQVATIMELMHAERTLLFSSDYRIGTTTTRRRRSPPCPSCSRNGSTRQRPPDVRTTPGADGGPGGLAHQPPGQARARFPSMASDWHRVAAVTDPPRRSAALYSVAGHNLVVVG